MNQKTKNLLDIMWWWFFVIIPVSVLILFWVWARVVQYIPKAEQDSPLDAWVERIKSQKMEKNK